MAVLAANMPTIVDIAKSVNPDGSVADVAEMLSQMVPVVQDIPFYPGNLPAGHRSTVRTSLPTITWRKLNAGTVATKSTKAQFDDSIGYMEAWSEVDKKVADASGAVEAYRLSESKAFVEAMGQEFSSTLFYGNTNTAPEEMNGLSIRYGATTNANGDNVILGGGGGADNSSVWIVCWGERSVHGIYPKGSAAGLQHFNKGLQVIDNAGGVTGARMEVYMDKFEWDCGLAVKDWRYIVRIPNIDISNLAAKSSDADLSELLIKGLHRLPDGALEGGEFKPVIYMNRSCAQYLRLQQRDDVQSGGGLTFENIAGKRVHNFDGVPVRVTDSLNQLETLVA